VNRGRRLRHLLLSFLNGHHRIRKVALQVAYIALQLSNALLLLRCRVLRSIGFGSGITRRRLRLLYCGILAVELIAELLNLLLLLRKGCLL